MKNNGIEFFGIVMKTTFVTFHNVCHATEREQSP